MKFILLVLMLTLFASANAQDSFKKVNREEVEKMISDKSESTYYPKLLLRFLGDDSTLTVDDFRLLYYGFVFQPTYSGYPDLKQKEINESIEKKDYSLGLKLCDSLLSNYPISLFGNYKKGLIFYLINNDDPNFFKFRDRYSNITNAIISTGDGLTCETAFKTIFVNDEYQIIYNYFEVEDFKGQSLQMPCDRMSITPSKYFKADQMYFDTSETFLYMEKMFKEK